MKTAAILALCAGSAAAFAPASKPVRYCDYQHQWIGYIHYLPIVVPLSHNPAKLFHQATRSGCVDRFIADLPSSCFTWLTLSFSCHRLPPRLSLRPRKLELPPLLDSSTLSGTSPTMISSSATVRLSASTAVSR